MRVMMTGPAMRQQHAVTFIHRTETEEKFAALLDATNEGITIH
jgi:hypothetical protein